MLEVMLWKETPDFSDDYLQQLRFRDLSQWSDQSALGCFALRPELSLVPDTARAPGLTPGRAGPS